jgi:hypothetical protein
MLIPRLGKLAIAITLSALAISQSANALSMKDCSTKYEAAKTGGTLGSKTWSEFRKAECGTEASMVPTAAKDQAAAPVEAARSGSTLFPKSIAKKYASESGGRARMHTCLDQYRANKADSRNGGLRWTEKGGGYYSECNKRLSQK